MKAQELDKRVGGGEDINAYVDGLDKLARHLGVRRQSLIKIWIAERLG